MDVYVDLLFLVNFSLNCFAIWLVSTLLGQRLRLRSLFLSATLGAIYGLGMVTPWAGQFANPLVKVLLAAGMVQVAFQPKRMARLIHLTGGFLLVSFVTAGCVLGAYSLLGNGPGGTLAYGQLPLWVLGVAVVGGGFFSQRAINLLENRLVHVANQAELSFQLGERSVTVSGLVDSGNQLTDPFGGRPVAIVTLAAVSDVFPEEITSLVLSGRPFEQSLSGWVEYPWVGRIRFIPYHSIGRRDGVLLGYRVDQVTVRSSAGVRCTHNVVIALSEHQMSEQGAYQALIPLRISPTAKSGQEVCS